MHTKVIFLPLPAPPVNPSHSWILSSLNDKKVPGNPPLTSHGTLEHVLGGVNFDGAQASLSGTLPSASCVVDPDLCVDGFAVGMKLRFDDLSLTTNKPQYVLDTGASDNYKGVSVFVQLSSLYFKVATSNAAYQVRLQLFAAFCLSVQSALLDVYVNTRGRDESSLVIWDKCICTRFPLSSEGFAHTFSQFGF